MKIKVGGGGQYWINMCGGIGGVFGTKGKHILRDICIVNSKT